MNRVGFPGCCAGNILYDFGGTNLTSGHKPSYTSDEIRMWLANNAGGSKFNVIAINGEQNTAMKPILEELGWECIAENVVSPGHPSSSVFLWLKAQYKNGQTQAKAPSNRKSIRQKRKTLINREEFLH